MYMSLISLVLLGIRIKEAVTYQTFKAAVFDKAPVAVYDKSTVPTREEALEMVKPNLDIYTQQAMNARQKGSQILVFAEYGLYPLGLNRRTIFPFLEEIPSPEEQWAPGDNISEYCGREILYTLAHIARSNSLYLVANMGDVVPCDREEDPNCPGDSRYQYNTNVIFDPAGVLVARYHKKHLFFEFHYDTPVHTDFSFLDTPFGRLGTFVCFDVLFYEPAIKLIEDYNVSTIAFPTAWTNVLPHYSAVPFHSSFAKGMSVNVLASNLHDPVNGFSGSGIYSYEKVLQYRNDEKSEEGALLTSNVPIKPVKSPRQHVSFEGLKESGDAFSNEVFGDVWKFVVVPTDATGELAVCQNSICCHLSYERDGNGDDDALFALAVFRGLHTKEGTDYLEICGFLKCLDKTEASCGQDVRSSDTHFRYFNLTGNFTTKYVFPMVVTDGIDPSAGQWTYDGVSTVSHGTDKGFVSAIQLGRRYDLDGSENTGTAFTSEANQNKYPVTFNILLYAFVMFHRSVLNV